MKKIISVIFLLILVFYYVYPMALPMFGYSFVSFLGALGLGVYVFRKFPYGEVVSILIPFACMFVWSYFCTFVNHAHDSHIMNYTKTQMAWFFGAYLLINIFYRIHPKGGIHLVMYYFVGVIFLQCVISVAMYMDETINDFFMSLSKVSELERAKRAETEGDRLQGYGVAFFGAGAICGFALILMAYIFMSRKFNFFQNLLFSVVYIFIFYVGLLSARTTIVGLVASLILMFVLLFSDGSKKGQFFLGLFFLIILSSIGYTLCYVYFPEFADWAFELFINYEQSGELRTQSSDGISEMLVFPDTAFKWIFGVGIGSFMFTDVGYSRLLLWFGLPGFFLYFTYQIMLIKQAFSRNRKLDLLLIATFVYGFVLNYKGLIDFNAYWLLFAFHCLYYEYYIYTPYLYRLGKFNQTKLRYAVQAAPAGRRVQDNV